MPLDILRGSEDVPAAALEGRTVGVIGFGNQGHAHALNLRDSGVEVIVANRADSANGRRARRHGFDPRPVAEIVECSDLVVVALPDEVQGEVYRSAIEPHLRSGAVLGFLHGFAVRYGHVEPRPGVGVVLVAPKGPGRTLRERYLEGRGLPSLLATHQETPDGDAEAVALAWAAGIGSARAGVIRTTFANETETDLFGEQAVLCGGLTALIVAAFEILVDAGYPPELAYLECCHEVKQVADLAHLGGLAFMMEQISNTAELGAYRAGDRLVDETVRERMRALLAEVRDGTFARVMIADQDDGAPVRTGRREDLERHPIEAAGRAVRELMPWLATDQEVDA